jgi:NAD(P)-dependent dehydrogenase (short-subunit alcohol dehydrogenase family)
MLAERIDERIDASPVLAFDANSLSGRVAVVTGAAGGLGHAISHRLCGMGASVVMIDKRPARSAPGLCNAIWKECDVTQAEEVQDLAQQVLKEFGRCDVLVNNAGIKTQPLPLEDMPLQDWDAVFAVNVRAAFLCARALAPAMLLQTRGSIVNVASVGARMPTRVGAYAASKAALCGLTRQMAAEWGPRGVRANTVSPGMVRTPMSDNHYRDDDRVRARLALLPVRRFGNPFDIADAVAFLASDASMFITGHDLLVDGGLSISALHSLQSPDG